MGLNPFSSVDIIATLFIPFCFDTKNRSSFQITFISLNTGTPY